MLNKQFLILLPFVIYCGIVLFVLYECIRQRLRVGLRIKLIEIIVCVFLAALAFAGLFLKVRFHIKLYFFMSVLALSILLIYIIGLPIKQLRKKDIVETIEVQTFFFSMLERVDQQLCNLKKMKHDMRDHKLIVSQIAKQEKSQVLLEHGKQLNLKFKELSIRSLLHESEKICLENDILPRFEVQFQTPIYISDIDFFRLCSNLLNNAMEACLADEETKHKYIDFSLTFPDGYLICRILNTKPVAHKVNLNVSTKDGSGNHGFGMKIVYGIIEKNNLHMETRDKGSTFCVEIFSDSIEKIKE